MNFRPVLGLHYDVASIAVFDINRDLSGDIIRDLFGLGLGAIHANRIFDFVAVNNLEMKSRHLGLLMRQCRNFIFVPHQDPSAHSSDGFQEVYGPTSDALTLHSTVVSKNCDQPLSHLVQRTFPQPSLHGFTLDAASAKRLPRQASMTTGSSMKLSSNNAELKE
jgi:hypothetical protein